MPVLSPHTQRRLRRRRLAGALALLALVGIVALLWQRPDPFAHPQIVRAELTDASGLAPIGAEVRIAGVPSGRVVTVSRQGDRAQLTLELDAGAGTVRRDATLALRPRLMFEGTAFVDLTLGSPAAPPLGDHELPLRQTSVYVPLDDALSILDARGRGNVRAVADATAGMLSARAPAQLRVTLGAAPALLGDATLVARAARGPQGGELRAAVGSLGRVAAAAASQAPALGRSLAETASVMRAAGGGGTLDPALTRLPATVASVRSGAGAASAILGSAQPLVGALRPGVAALQPAIDAVRPLLRGAVPTLARLAPVLADAGVAVAGAGRGAGPALGAIRALRPSLEILYRTLIPALEARTDLGDPAYEAFLGLFAGGGAASRPFGVDGQGHFMRFGLRFLTGAGQPLPPCTLLEQANATLATALQAVGGCTP